jgi:FimV-like protein
MANVTSILNSFIKVQRTRAALARAYVELGEKDKAIDEINELIDQFDQEIGWSVVNSLAEVSEVSSG